MTPVKFAIFVSFLAELCSFSRISYRRLGGVMLSNSAYRPGSSWLDSQFPHVVSPLDF